jgi:hypothetical protein
MLENICGTLQSSLMMQNSLNFVIARSPRLRGDRLRDEAIQAGVAAAFGLLMGWFWIAASRRANARIRTRPATPPPPPRPTPPTPTTLLAMTVLVR